MMKLPTVAFLAMFVAIATLTSSASGCMRIKAAMRFNGTAYIFFGKDYVGLDETYTQNTELREVQPDWNAPWPDAAIMPWWTASPFFFSDAYFFFPQNGIVPYDAKDFGGEFFEFGLDAAGYLNNTPIYFKDCWFKSGGFNLVTGPMFPNEVLSLPCSPDAALTEGENLIVFKDDMMYVVEPDGLQDGMPIPTDLMITFHDDIQLCAEDEVENKK